jgi:hypothetical protein
MEVLEMRRDVGCLVTVGHVYKSDSQQVVDV